LFSNVQAVTYPVTYLAFFIMLPDYHLMLCEHAAMLN